jgi:hypothetical protein
VDSESIGTVLGLLLRWRVVVSLIGSTLAAWALIRYLPGFNPAQCIVVALLGWAAGGWWEAAARPGSHRVPASRPPTRTAVAVLAAAFAGGAWGAVSSGSMPSAMAGLALFAITAWTWFRYAVAARRWLDAGTGILAIAAAAVSFAAAAVLLSVLAP